MNVCFLMACNVCMCSKLLMMMGVRWRRLRVEVGRSLVGNEIWRFFSGGGIL